MEYKLFEEFITLQALLKELGITQRRSYQIISL